MPVGEVGMTSKLLRSVAKGALVTAGTDKSKK